jgi:hypothetical protein
MMAMAQKADMLDLYSQKTAVFRSFRWVITGRLARSSAPHYSGRDEDQNMDQEAVDFLVSEGITNIISFNAHPLSQEEMDRLNAQRITYHHICLPDFAAPTLNQLEMLQSYYTAGGPTLIYCGFGQGRTGTAISALQLYDGRRLVDIDYKANGVETSEQIKALDDLKDMLEW